MLVAHACRLSPFETPPRAHAGTPPQIRSALPALLPRDLEDGPPPMVPPLLLHPPAEPTEQHRQRQQAAERQGPLEALEGWQQTSRASQPAGNQMRGQQGSGVSRFLSGPWRRLDWGGGASASAPDDLPRADSSGSAAPLLRAPTSEPPLPRRQSEAEAERRRQRLQRRQQDAAFAQRRHSAPAEAQLERQQRTSSLLLGSFKPSQFVRRDSQQAPPSAEPGGASGREVGSSGTAGGAAGRSAVHDPVTCERGASCRFCAHLARQREASQSP